jgi:glycosyltransferase involved in cell wall biosynthesis
LVDAMSLLRHERSVRHLKAVVIGDGVDLARIREYARSRNILNELVFTGYVFDVDRFMSAFDIFLLPSHREGLPAALLDALSMGIPAIATDIRGCRELITHGETGMLVPPGDVAALAAAIDGLIRMPEQRDALGRGAEERVHREYAEEVVLGRTVDTIRQLMERSLVKRTHRHG